MLHYEKLKYPYIPPFFFIYSPFLSSTFSPAFWEEKQCCVFYVLSLQIFKNAFPLIRGEGGGGQYSSRLYSCCSHFHFPWFPLKSLTDLPCRHCTQIDVRREIIVNAKQKDFKSIKITFNPILSALQLTNWKIS